jgi:RNA polymerase sigma-70 factor (ECF subfamily)
LWGGQGGGFLEKSPPARPLISNVTDKEQVFSDDDVVRSVREGHTRNFEILIDRYKHKIINFIYRMIDDSDEARSLSQDVFLKVFSTLKQYRTQGNFQAFIFTVAKNITLNHIKKQKRVTLFSRLLPGKDDISDGYGDSHFQVEGTQHEALERQQQDEILTAAMKRLNENQRIALILKVYLDFSYHRIREITGWSIPKIETLISRAKRYLGDEIHSILNEPPGKKIKNEVQENKSIDVLKVRPHEHEEKDEV